MQPEALQRDWRQQVERKGIGTGTARPAAFSVDGSDLQQSLRCSGTEKHPHRVLLMPWEDLLCVRKGKHFDYKTRKMANK